MNIEQLRDFCIKKQGVTASFPFDRDVLVLKVLDKIFLLTSLQSWENGTPTINLKCDPNYAEELRAEYTSIQPGYHMSKKHWNTIQVLDGELQPKFIQELINHSYDMVVQSMPKKKRLTLEN